MLTVPGDAPNQPTGLPKELQPTPSDFMMVAALMHKSGQLPQSSYESLATDPNRYDEHGNLKIKQTERPLYGPEDPEGALREGPMKLTPGSKVDPYAKGFVIQPVPNK